MNKEEIEKNWTDKATKALVGKKIVKVQYMTVDNSKEFDWNQRPLLLTLDDGSVIFPQSDDEGNDGGALGHCPPKGKEEDDNHEDVFPVLWRY